MILCPLSMNLQNSNAFLLYEIYIFELKPNFFLYSYQKNGHTPFFQKKNFFFCSHQKKVIVNKVISSLKQCLQLASIHGSFSYIQHLYTQRKTTKKFNFELLCLYHISYDIQLIICFKESGNVKTLFSVVKNLDQYYPVFVVL